jgi:hypothetical protein
MTLAGANLSPIDARNHINDSGRTLGNRQLVVPP